jgi:hypothetical protein
VPGRPKGRVDLSRSAQPKAETGPDTTERGPPRLSPRPQSGRVAHASGTWHAHTRRGHRARGRHGGTVGGACRPTDDKVDGTDKRGGGAPGKVRGRWSSPSGVVMGRVAIRGRIDGVRRWQRRSTVDSDPEIAPIAHEGKWGGEVRRNQKGKRPAPPPIDRRRGWLRIHRSRWQTSAVR